MKEAGTSRGEGSGEGGQLRLDRWLWHARFYKTRSLATAAVNGGHVQLNGERAKAGRNVRPGDRLDISAGPGPLSVVVRSLPVRRGPATEARACYEETPESIEARAQAALQRRAAGSLRTGPDRRPDRRERAEILRLHGRR